MMCGRSCRSGKLQHGWFSIFSRKLGKESKNIRNLPTMKKGFLHIRQPRPGTPKCKPFPSTGAPFSPSLPAFHGNSSPEKCKLYLCRTRNHMGEFMREKHRNMEFFCHVLFLVKTCDVNVMSCWRCVSYALAVPAHHKADRWFPLAFVVAADPT